MMRAAALQLAEHGWPVHPLQPRSKVPLTEHGFQDATTDLDQITKWWTQWRHANIGCRIPDSLVAIDIDPRHGGSLERLQALVGPLPETLQVISGRGDGGAHYYFLRPPGALTGARLPKRAVSLLTHNAILPPSIHPVSGRPYCWGPVEEPAPLPARLRELLRPAPAPIPIRRNRRLPTDGAALVRFVSLLTDGDRNAGLFWASMRAAEGGLAIEDELLEGAASTGLPIAEARRTIASARRTIGGRR